MAMGGYARTRSLCHNRRRFKGISRHSWLDHPLDQTPRRQVPRVTLLQILRDVLFRHQLKWDEGLLLVRLLADDLHSDFNRGAALTLAILKDRSVQSSVADGL